MMKNNSIVFLAEKYLKNRGKGFIGRSHYLTLAGISLGVLALIVVSSVMNGFQTDMQKRLIGTLAEVRISPPQGKSFEDYPAVQAKLSELGFLSSPVIRNELMLKHSTMVVPTLSFGIDPAQHAKVSKILQPAGNDPEQLTQGVLIGSMDSLCVEDGGIALGAGLAYQLGVDPGDSLQVLSPSFSLPTAFGMLPKMRTLRIRAIFSSGMPDYDTSYSFIPLQTAAFFSGNPGSVDYLEIKTPNTNRSRRYASILQKEFPSHQVDDWSKFDTSLYTAMRFEKFLMFVIMLFMYIIASFNLTGNMLKTISQKKRELGLLKAIGYQYQDLRDLFLSQSMILSGTGIVAGLSLGSLILLLQKWLGLVKLPIGEAEVIVLPVRFELADYLMIIAVACLFTLVSVLLPLKRLKKIDAVELIRQTN
ncbi:MAG TPA: ABC transporter permease [Candidatus Cloacimonadota bacterium]|nr:ABC transporter permease [Candidatus Cloacimonadota bacterium]